MLDVFCVVFVGKPTPPTPTHQGIPWVFPFLMRGFLSVILRTRVLIFARDYFTTLFIVNQPIKPGDQAGPDCQNVSRSLLIYHRNNSSISVF